MSFAAQGNEGEAFQGSLPDERNERLSLASSKVDLPRIENAVREILAAVGEDPDREGLRETPSRVARMYAELFSGLHNDPRLHLQKFFTEKYDEIVLVRDISFESFCEHHLMPFMGKAHIAYLPDGRVLGLSKLARVVEGVARRPQVQERMTETIADLLIEELQAKGVAVVVEAVHTCMTVRGVRKPGSVCVTSAMKGGVPFQPVDARRGNDPDLRGPPLDIVAQRTPRRGTYEGLRRARDRWASWTSSARGSRTTCGDWSAATCAATIFSCRCTPVTPACTKCVPRGWCAPAPRTTSWRACNTRRKSGSRCTRAGRDPARPAESLGSGLILDFSRYLHHVKFVGENSVRVQPGVIHERLNAQLRSHRRIFGPDPANSRVTTIGSVLAVDGAGSHWLKYGSARQHVLSMRVVLADGTLLDVGREPLDLPADAHPRKRELVDRLARLIQDHAQLIHERQPGSHVNRCGYQLGDVLDDGHLHLARLLAGSEGSLALIVEAVLATQPLPLYRAVSLLLFDSLDHAALRGALRARPPAQRLRPHGPPPPQPGARERGPLRRIDPAGGRGGALGRG